jgi:predicted CXXCH cytochrome family protein
LCQLCHKEQTDPARTLVHGGTAAGSCAACHEPHSAEHSRLLKQPAVALCTSCHKEVQPAPGEALSTHAPARDNCLACHEAHTSKHPYALKQPASELCLSCHKDVKDSLAANPVVHGAMAGEQSCLACHVSHASRLSKLQKEPQPRQCLNCHDRTLFTAGGRAVTNMAALLRENPDHHGPIRLGACTACHQPHGANEPRLLSAAYPPEFYAAFRPEQYQLCFGCHTPDLVLVPQATAPTGFKDGERNLHWLHVNQEKGRTCRACHEVHASRQPFHIRESVPFGPSGWAITLKYRKTATGGTCEAGCHGEKSYDHGGRPRTLSVVALSPRGQALLNGSEPAVAPATAPVTPAGDGVGGDYPVPAPPFTPGAFPCTACHDPMLAVNAQRRALGKPHEDVELRHDEQHRWCLDCHNAQNRDVLRSAAGEPISFAESYRLCGQCHGSQYRDWKVGVHGKRTGAWGGRKEYLLCVHCHDPHAPKFKPIAPLPPPARPKSH